MHPSNQAFVNHIGEPIQTARIVAMVLNGAPLVISLLLLLALWVTRGWEKPTIDRRKVWLLIVMGSLWGLSGILGNLTFATVPVTFSSYLGWTAQGIFDVMGAWLQFEFLMKDRLGNPGGAFPVEK